MADEILDFQRFADRRSRAGAASGTMALWGAEGERSRFALPLWRVVHLAGADRGLIFWRSEAGEGAPETFLALDIGQDPARLDVPEAAVACLDGDPESGLHDLGPEAMVVCLGSKDGRVWALVADGGRTRPPLSSRTREDILFLSGECAGLLFLRDFADEAGDPPTTGS
jgi:hypothetical protein